MTDIACRDISVVIPTHRRPDLLRRLLNSMQAEAEELEVIVVNDGTADVGGYEELVREAQARFSRFRYITLPRSMGAPAARNTGIRLASGAWIALVDDDDEWLAGKVAAQVDAARRASPDVGLIYCWTQVLGPGGELEARSRPTIEGRAASHILRTNFILSPSVLVRRDVFEKVGGFDESLPSCQDWDMWTRILCGGYACQVVKQELAVYHRHGGASVGLSPRAKQGYVLFLRKHWRSILRHTGPLNWARKALLYARLIVQGA